MIVVVVVVVVDLLTNSRQRQHTTDDGSRRPQTARQSGTIALLLSQVDKLIVWDAACVQNRPGTPCPKDRDTHTLLQRLLRGESVSHIDTKNGQGQSQDQMSLLSPCT